MNPIPLPTALRMLFPSRRVTSDRLADFRLFWSHLVRFINHDDVPTDPAGAVAHFRRHGIESSTWAVMVGSVTLWQTMRRKERGKRAALTRWSGGETGIEDSRSTHQASPRAVRRR